MDILDIITRETYLNLKLNGFVSQRPQDQQFTRIGVR